MNEVNSPTSWNHASAPHLLKNKNGAQRFDEVPTFHFHFSFFTFHS